MGQNRLIGRFKTAWNESDVSNSLYLEIIIIVKQVQNKKCNCASTQKRE